MRVQCRFYCTLWFLRFGDDFILYGTKQTIPHRNALSKKKHYIRNSSIAKDTILPNPRLCQQFSLAQICTHTPKTLKCYIHPLIEHYFHENPLRYEANNYNIYLTFIRQTSKVK